jgi:hypothetical protein
MNNFTDNEKPPFRGKFVVIKKINRMKSLLCDWYGEKSGKSQISAYMPKCIHVRDAVKRILSNISYEDGILLEKLQNAWNKLVGTEVSNNSNPVSLEHGILIIEAKNSVWLSELKNFYAHKIEEQVRTICGDSVKKIYFSPAGK